MLITISAVSCSVIECKTLVNLFSQRPRTIRVMIPSNKTFKIYLARLMCYMQWLLSNRRVFMNYELTNNLLNIEFIGFGRSFMSFAKPRVRICWHKLEKYSDIYTVTLYTIRGYFTSSSAANALFLYTDDYSGKQLFILKIRTFWSWVLQNTSCSCAISYDYIVTVWLIMYVNMYSSCLLYTSRCV